ncbi:MFS transporter [Streptomyces sp. MS1.HAVA.3]|uniref:MFS transporter n=1 Tax=Streptomyces caledonius TaxID=3134107 RepID=A0ABU8UB53_9ACTN
MTSSPRRRRERHPGQSGRRPYPPRSTQRLLPTGSPWRDQDFRTLFGAAALNQLGTNTGHVATPLLALTALDASPAQVGTLAALSTLAFPSSACRPGPGSTTCAPAASSSPPTSPGDLARAALFASLPLAWWLDALTLGPLYAVVLLGGCATVFSDLGSQSVLPQLIGREGLVRANTALVTLMSAADIAGRGTGGALVAVLTAPFAPACSSAAYLASALRLTGIRATPAPAATARTPLATQIREGLQHVLGHPELRALALTATLNNLGSAVLNTMLPVLFVREPGLSPTSLGPFWAAGGVGLLLGARLARPLAGRLGDGRALLLSLIPAALLVPLLGRSPWLWLAGGAWLLTMMKIGSDNVLGVSLRRHLTPDALMGRMNATFRFTLTGALALGSATSGLPAELTTLHTTLWTGAALLAASWTPVTLSPSRAAAR